MSECRLPGCTEESRARGDPERPNNPDGPTVGVFGAKFCSVMHELKYEHIKADAEDARRADIAEARNGE
ncbi:hypothetical protein HUG10_20620 (plasmid) [Halorarum halophilum]|uniref:Uncharacterized protein n=1 Tax=Halorarum halophilum TaxID=2743090 RepID=A0A7D5H3Z7_9EURY|nr:hypothetical protein [Halobaculum halophilum]QLG30013.1 hypothetical protein HUG10_20620 [Halobaculum halophilum]